MRYIDADKLIVEIKRRKDIHRKNYEEFKDERFINDECEDDRVLSLITSLQQEQPNNMIQWTGSNLKEVIDFTGKSPRFDEWFKSWDKFESYVHSHGDILKLFCKDGSHYEVPVGAWIVKTPDGYNVPSVARFIHAKQEQPIEGKQVIIITETDGDSNIEWDCRSLDDVIALLKSAESFITEKQIEKIAGPGSGPDYATTEGRYSHLFKHKQEQPEVDLENYISDKLRELSADLIDPFNRGLNAGMANAYNDILDRLNARKQESVEVAESPSKTFPRVNEFDGGSSYRR